jgi:transposase
MSRPKKYPVRLNDAQHTQLKTLLSKGDANARVLTRARILLLAHKDWFDKDVATALQVNPSTVMNVRKRFSTGGLDNALYDKPRPGAQRKLDGKQEALLVALACSDPEDRETWTMQLLADKLVELDVVAEISDETVRRTLKKTSSSRGRRSSGALAG